MNLARVFAFRYVFSRKKANAINIISGITVLAFAIGTAALIIVLSALNGFEKTLSTLFNSFDPDLKIESVNGKTFSEDRSVFEKIKNTEGVSDLVYYLEDYAVVKHGSSQEIAIIKGVSENYDRITKIDSIIIEGDFNLGKDDLNGGIVGYELSRKLGLNMNVSLGVINAYSPGVGETDPLHPEKNVNTMQIFHSGTFYVQEDIDGKYIITSIGFAKKLFGKKKSITGIEVSLKKSANAQKVKETLKGVLGKSFTIKDKYEQKESIYKIFKSEKMATFSILSFILLIAAFNMMGALTMLIIEKKPDISILRSMGLNELSIGRIFFNSGMIIAVMGSLIGLILGGSICLFQMKYGLIRLENSVVEAYPMALKYSDFLMVFLISLGIGMVTSWFPSRRIN
ncbi:MAG: ABC transporter permease [Flavobacteriales bacterium]|nr:ABC transporter permease [Flavobacteriales bacterium]